MALTKAQLSLVSVSTLGVAAGGYTAQLAAFNSQKEAAAFIATTGLLNEGTNAEFVNTVAGNLNNLASTAQKAAFFKALEDGATRADAAVDFANAQLVEHGSIPNVNKAIASTSTSMDLTALKAEITPVDSAQTVTFNTANGKGFAQKDLQANLGKAEIENSESKISADFTFELKNQANVFTDDAFGTAIPGATGGKPTSTVGEFTGAFLSPMLERAAAVQSDSAIYVKLLDGFALRDNFQSIERLATNGIGFSIDGVTVVVADKPEDGNQGAIYKAKNYVELKDALTARLAELASGQGLPAGADAAIYAKLATFTVELGSNFSKANQAGDQVTGTELVIKDASGSTLVPQGFSTFGGIHPHTDLNAINELTNQAPSTSTQLISTNINAENVGYGSQGATLNIAGQSASKKGVEEFKLTATKDVWFTRLESRDTESNHHLQEVLLQSGSNGYFRVGTQDKGANLVALVDQNFGAKGGGLVDVIKLDAAAANSTSVNAFISDDVIARNYDLQDIDSNYKKDDVNVNYSLTGGDDVLQLAVASEVLAYADTQVNIVAGGGNDLVHLKVVDNALKDGLVENADVLTKAYGKGWLANQQLNDNVKIDAASGDNTIWTEGSGNVRITTGGGNDTIYADNSGRTSLTKGGAVEAKLKALGMGTDVNALYVFNARSADIGDILSNTANATDSVTNVDQVFQTFKNTVAVTFKGFESKYIEIASTDYVTSTQQINQAIKEAINKDATLNKLIVAKEFPGNVLVIESLIDGEQQLTDLSFDFVAPAKNGTTATSTPPLAKGQIALGTNDLKDAAKAYDKAGTATADIAEVTVSDLNVETDIQTTYNLNTSGQAEQFAKDGAGTITPEVQTVSLTAGKMQAGDTLTFTVPSDAATGTATVTFTATADLADQDEIAAAIATGTGVTGLPAGVTVSALTTPNPGDVVFTFSNFVPSTTTAVGTTTNPVTYEAVAGTENIVEAGVANTTAAQLTLEITGGALRKGDTVEVDVYNGGASSVTVTLTATENLTTTDDIAAAIQAAIAADTAVTNANATVSGSTITIDVDASDVTNAAVTSTNGFDLTTTGSTDNSSTTMTDVAGTGSATTTGSGSAAADVTGADSLAHSDNVINAGGGNDVIVLGTGEFSNDTVVLTGSFGKTTIVNFDATTVAPEAINGGDLLDFRTYLDANYGATTSANVTVSTATSGNVAANAITVVKFSDLQSNTGTTATVTGGIKDTDKLGSVTAAQLAAELNEDYDAASAATKNVFLIHNDGVNDGEYLVVTATSTDNTTTGTDFVGVTIVGTLDFGAEVTDFSGNIVGFDGAIA